MSKLRGAIPSARHKLARAKPYDYQPAPIPESFARIPEQLSIWGNDKFGDCVSAEEAFAKATNTPELFVLEADLIKWARAHRLLNGAELTDVMDIMREDGLPIEGKRYGDGTYHAVDWTNDAILCAAIYQGPVKIAVAADQLENAVKSTSGWVLTGAHIDASYDHCVSLCGYGTLDELAALLNVQLGIADGTARGYLLFTWGTIGIIDQASLIAICGEAWLRSPTTVSQ